MDRLSKVIVSAALVSLGAADSVQAQGQLVLKGHTGQVRTVAFSPDGRMVASGGEDGVIALWDSKGRKVGRLFSKAGELRSLAFSPDGKKIAASYLRTPDPLAGGGVPCTAPLILGHEHRWENQCALKIWDVPRRREWATLWKSNLEIEEVAFSPDGRSVAAAGQEFIRKSATVAYAESVVRLWEMATSQERGAFRGHVYVIESVAFSGDGRMLATVGKDRKIRLWDLVTGRERCSLEACRDQRGQIAFSPDGKVLAAAGGRLVSSSGKPATGEVHFWEVASGRRLSILQGHGQFIRSIAFSPDGSTLVSGSYDGSVKLWDLSTRKEKVTFRGHRGRVFSVAFSPAGKFLASGGADGTVRVWDLTSVR